jgi:hypothetical protein
VKLQTQLHLVKNSPAIGYDSKLFLIGSCFAENIADKFSYYKFQNYNNPLGVLFHPLAILDLLTKAQNNYVYADKDLFFSNGQWQSFAAHSHLNSPSKIQLLERLNSAVQTTRKQLCDTSHIVLTFGTAWVYKHIQSQVVVSNCHKQPQKEFEKFILSIDQLTAAIESIISIIKSMNKEATIIFSISPVRHLKDGFVENTHSKSQLIASLHPIVVKSEKTHYFPSYELLMDELRDYRFYKDDMLHPSQLAIDYVWDKFKATWIEAAADPIMKAVNHLQKGMEHKPFNADSKAHKVFLDTLRVEAETLMSRFPFMKFEL